MLSDSSNLHQIEQINARIHVRKQQEYMKILFQIDVVQKMPLFFEKISVRLEW